MANVNVTYNDLYDAARRLKTGETEITTKLNELKAFIANLIQNGYVTDQSSKAFGETYEKFTSSSTQTISALEGLATFLNTAAQTLSDTDQGLAASIQS